MDGLCILKGFEAEVAAVGGSENPSCTESLARAMFSLSLGSCSRCYWMLFES